jgi:hypothetical protein
MSGSQLKYKKFLFEITDYWAGRQMRDGKDAIRVKRRWRQFQHPKPPETLW